MMNHTRIKEAVEIMRNGGVIVYPTETVYGIGCDPFNKDACERVQGLKKRKKKKTLLLLACSLAQVENFAGELAEVPRRLAQVFWPGPLTMVIKPAKDLPGYLFGRTRGVAFRVTSYPVASLLARDYGCPIISTSANLTGQPPIVTYEEAVKIFGKTADIILENDEPLHGKPSTVVDLTSTHLAIIREGSITISRIQEAL
ncbi:MAG TPA: L-threonylcarbamoyladenylate synthase [Anaerolineae bacterium]|nr:L-threonylcarbamoyladenylate synthase [Anaerolineae bacterium]